MESLNMVDIITITVIWTGAIGGVLLGLLFVAYALVTLLDPILDYARLVLKHRLDKRARLKRLI